MNPYNVFNIKNNADFNTAALEVFKFQYNYNKIYQKYLNILGVDIKNINNWQKIPFLPIEIFKKHNIISNIDINKKADLVFESSGTTGQNTSKHILLDQNIYIRSFLSGFKMFYGKPEDYCILALLPSYLERNNSSLVFMIKHLIDLSNDLDSGFYLYNYNDLAEKLMRLKKNEKKILLIGVSYALLEFANQYPMKLSNTIVMETGGMKGRSREMIRDELHDILKIAFSINKIHSEYGMTELLSQAYSRGNGIFQSPPWMKILIRDIYDPFSVVTKNATGGINIIDLANYYSCSFIETKDVGKRTKEGVEILGRFDNSDIRGCNLMIS